jgi:hypothetical protein
MEESRINNPPPPPTAVVSLSQPLPYGGNYQQFQQGQGQPSFPVVIIPPQPCYPQIYPSNNNTQYYANVPQSQHETELQQINIEMAEVVSCENVNPV